MSNIDIEKIELAAAEELDARTKNRTYSTFIEPADVMELVGRLRAAERERDEISRDYDVEHYHRLAIERSEQALAAHVERINRHAESCANELAAMIDRYNTQNTEDGSWDYDYQTPHDLLMVVRDKPKTSLALLIAEKQDEAVNAAVRAAMPGPCNPPDDPPAGFQEYCEGIVVVLEAWKHLRRQAEEKRS